MEEKVALVTGASRGLGRALAIKLRDKGYKVYSGAREIGLAPENTFPVYLELKREESIDRALQTILAREKKIDLLINNAAIAYWGALDGLTVQEMQDLFQVNFFGPFYLVQKLLPFMRQRREGRILFISSIRGVESSAFMGAYAASKAALEAIAFDWATTLCKWNIKVSVAQPGPMETGIKLKHGSYFASEKENPYLPYGEVSLESQPVDEAASAIMEHLELPSPPFRFQTNKHSSETVAKHLKDPTGIAWYQEQKEWVLGQKK